MLFAAHAFKNNVTVFNMRMKCMPTMGHVFEKLLLSGRDSIFTGLKRTVWTSLEEKVVRLRPHPHVYLNRQCCFLKGKVSFENIRFYASKSKKEKLLPFERAQMAQKFSGEHLLYHNKSNRFYNAILLFGFSEFVMLAFLSLTLYQFQIKPSDTDMVEINKKEGTMGTFTRLTVKMMSESYKTGFVLTLNFIGLMVFFLTVAYPSRVVRQLWLMESGNLVKITTFTPFGRNQAIITPISNISSIYGASTSTHVPIKIRGHSFYFLIDKDGEFVDKISFENHIRNLK